MAGPSTNLRLPEQGLQAEKDAFHRIKGYKTCTTLENNAFALAFEKGDLVQVMDVDNVRFGTVGRIKDIQIQEHSDTVHFMLTPDIVENNLNIKFPPDERTTKTLMPPLSVLRENCINLLELSQAMACIVRRVVIGTSQCNPDTIFRTNEEQQALNKEKIPTMSAAVFDNFKGHLSKA